VGDWSLKGPGIHSKQRDFVSVTGPSLLRADKLLEPNQELEQWNGMEETNFLFFKYSSSLSLFLLTSKQESGPTRAAAAQK